MGLKVCKLCSAFTQAGGSLCVSSERGCEVCLYCELILDRLKRHVSRHVTTISNVTPLVTLCVLYAEPLQPRCFNKRADCMIYKPWKIAVMTSDTIKN